MVIQQFLRMLRARFSVIALIFLTTLGVTVSVSLMLTKKYQASTTLVVEVKGTDPVLGGAVAGLAPPLFALVQFPTYWPALILLVGLQLILFVVGNLIQPRMQGDNQNIDPVAVLLALALWGKMWGVVGMFLSTPLAVMAMAILAEFKGSMWIAVLLSGDGKPYADDDDKPARHHAPAKRPARVKPPRPGTAEP
jgi:hypothetical protein